MKILIVAANTRSLINFRGDLIRAIRKLDFSVLALSEKTSVAEVIAVKNTGASFVSYPVQRNGMNPIRDMRTWLALRAIFKTNQPDTVLAYTIKPVIWGGLATRVVPNAKFYALITGLGFAFQTGVNRGWLTNLVSFLYRISLRRAEKVIFQNEDNLNEFVLRGIVPRDKCVRVWGSGVDLTSFNFESIQEGAPIFLAIGRLLGEKGIREYVEAASIVKLHYPNAKFQWLGGIDPSPDGISIEDVMSWHNDGILEYLGETNDVRPFIANCKIFVLPSYHEGMPRSTLEALAIGRPVLTTDVSGCRDTVIIGENGFLVPKANSHALAERMIWFIENPDSWQAMGLASRKLAEVRFDVCNVNAEMLRIMGLT